MLHHVEVKFGHFINSVENWAHDAVFDVFATRPCSVKMAILTSNFSHNGQLGGGPKTTAFRWWPTVVVGAAWAGLSLWLSHDGASPSGPSPFGANHYAIQAWLIVPTLLLSGLVFARVTWQGLTTARPGYWAWAPVALKVHAAALGLGWVAPDLVAYAAGGFAALKMVVALCPLLATVIAVAVGYRVVRPRSDRHGLPLLARLVGGWALSAVVLMLVVR